MLSWCQARDSTRSQITSWMVLQTKVTQSQKTNLDFSCWSSIHFSNSQRRGNLTLWEGKRVHAPPRTAEDWETGPGRWEED